MSPAAWDALLQIGQSSPHLTPEDLDDPARFEQALCANQPARPADFQVVLVGRICRATARSTAFLLPVFSCIGKPARRLGACMGPPLLQSAVALRSVAELDARLGSLLRSRCRQTIAASDAGTLMIARANERLARIVARGRPNASTRALDRWFATIMRAAKVEAEQNARFVRACAPRGTKLPRPQTTSVPLRLG
ncbi:MAG: hypothetical protein R2736_11115 [Solirubrobacterales bacterium]